MLMGGFQRPLDKYEAYRLLSYLQILNIVVFGLLRPPHINIIPNPPKTSSGTCFLKLVVKYFIGGLIMPDFLARKEKTKTKRPVEFKTSSGVKVEFKAHRKPLRRERVIFKAKS